MQLTIPTQPIQSNASKADLCKGIQKLLNLLTPTMQLIGTIEAQSSTDPQCETCPHTATGMQNVDEAAGRI